MKVIILRILTYLIVSAIGFSVYALYTHFLIATNGYPENEGDKIIFNQSMINGSTLAWLAGMLTGLFYFWLGSGWKNLFLTLPILFPLGFCIFHTMTY